ncbi:hypothetical protein [Leisingera daeponensis]|uniref:hypothetical protein n=1 Tax=Leisingera daeponensis TaxID=405746 RepID=UPI001C977FA2|nr:hypothetical protein [Leisingera daeponensis]MBY6058158.1 hypothetical protein [Leisingera daeponensis]
MISLGFLPELIGGILAFALVWCFLSWAPLFRQAAGMKHERVVEEAVQKSRPFRRVAVCLLILAIGWVLAGRALSAWQFQLLCGVGAVSGSISFWIAGRVIWQWREGDGGEGLGAEKLKVALQAVGLIVLGLLLNRTGLL